MEGDQPQDSIALPSQTPASLQTDSLDQILDILEPFDESIHGPPQQPSPHQPETLLQGQYSNVQASPDAAEGPQQSSHTAPGSRKSKPLHQPAPAFLQAEDVLRAPQSATPSNNSQLHLAAAQPQSKFSSHARLNSEGQVQSKPHTGLSKNELSPELSERFHSADDAQPMSADGEQSTAAQQQACVTDDGDFERMMARFDELEQQEAAQTSSASAGTSVNWMAKWESMHCQTALLDTCRMHHIGCPLNNIAFHSICKSFVCGCQADTLSALLQAS